MKREIFQESSSASLAKTFARYRGHLGPSGPRLHIESENERNYFDSFLTLFWTFGAPWPRGPGNSFSESICNFGPDPNDPCSGQKFSQAFITKPPRGNNPYWGTPNRKAQACICLLPETASLGAEDARPTILASQSLLGAAAQHYKAETCVRTREKT